MYSQYLSLTSLDEPNYRVPNCTVVAVHFYDEKRIKGKRKFLPQLNTINFLHTGRLTYTMFLRKSLQELLRFKKIPDDLFASSKKCHRKSKTNPFGQFFGRYDRN